ncbi:MAG: hypothetical protein J3K34DRAFT_201157 [Monoraphidium minutum]|nr:MAG: hypothetical protein J3K34DRAFT_201157 [Monoraphidium minutum]
MSVAPSVEFRVHPTYYTLASKVAHALTTEVAAAPASTAFTPHGLHLVDPDAVASVLEDDYIAGGGGGGAATYTLYLLNPKVDRPYAYSYDKERRSCPGGVYVSRQHRYAFYDLSANVTFYGPGPGGKGQVLEHSVPVLSHYRPESLRRAVLPDLAALVWSGVQHLAWPPLHSGDIGYAGHVAIHIVYMHQDLLGPVSHVDKVLLERELRSALKGIQELEVFEHSLPFGECAACVAGYSGALRTRTAEAHEGGESVTLSQYLDLQALELWDREMRDSVLSDVGVTLAEAARDGAKVLPVFVFDVAGTDAVLIGESGRGGVWRQAVALEGGDVIAVRSGQASVPTFYGCGLKAVHLDPADLQRPVMAALLQSGWGVADTALFWSPATGRSWNWLWSLGSTPFGPLSASMALSFAQRDAMGRNLALAALNASAGHAAAVVAGFAKVGGPGTFVKAHLDSDQIQPYNQRIALLLFKLQEASAALSRLDTPAALGYAASMAHDAAALHAIARRAGAGLSIELQCAGAAARRRWWAVPGGAGAIVFGLCVWRALVGGRGRGGGKRHSHVY